MKPVMRRTLRRTLLVVGALLLCVCVGVSVLLFTEWGHARVAEIASSRVSDAIAGELRIGHIDEIDLPRVRARDVQLVAPDGTPAIDVKRVTVELDLRAALSGIFAWHRADIDGGIVRVIEDHEGKLNMEETFRAASSDGDTRREGTERGAAEDTLQLRRMATSSMTLLIGGKSLPELRLVRLHGIMSIRVRDDGSVALRFDEYRGGLVDGLPSGRLDFADVTGEVHSKSTRLLWFDGHGTSEGEPVTFALEVGSERGSPRDDHERKQRVRIDATFPRLSAESLSTSILAAWTKLKGDVDLEVHHGARDEGADARRAPRKALASSKEE